MRRWLLDKASDWILTIVLFIIIGVIIYALFTQEDAEANVFNFLREVAPIIAAGATLFLAWAALQTIREARHMRDENRDIDFRRRTLDEIVNWVMEVNKYCIPPVRIGELEAYLDDSYKEWCRRISSSLSSDGKWALRNSHIFGAEFEGKINSLVGIIMSMNERIREIGVSRKFTDKEAGEQLSKHFVTVLEYTDSVLDAALKIKSDEKL